MDVEAKSCTFQWEIKNISQCWWLRRDEGIYSPTFIADGLEGTEWSMCCFPKGHENASFIYFSLERDEDGPGPDDIMNVHLELSLIDIEGSILEPLKRTNLPFNKENSLVFRWERRDKVFLTERESFLPEDTMTVQCIMWASKEKPINSNRIFASTYIKVERRTFTWDIENPSSLKSDMTNKFKDDLIDFDLLLFRRFCRLYMNMPSAHDSIKYISCRTSIIDSDGIKENFGIKQYFDSDISKGRISSVLVFSKLLLENKSQYFPNDILSFEFEFVVSTVEHFGHGTNFVWIRYGNNDDDTSDEDSSSDDGVENRYHRYCTGNMT